MKTHRYLYATASGWHLSDFCTQASSGQQPERAQCNELDTTGVLRTLNAKDSKEKSTPHRLVIGVPAQWCLCAGLSSEGLPTGQRAAFQQALAYRLEAEIPITAEQCAFDFVSSGSNCLGIALQADRLQTLVHQLEDAGHIVEAVVPRALLTAQGWQAEGTIDPLQNPSVLLWCESSSPASHGKAQLLHLCPDQPPQWRTLEAQPDAITQQLTIDQFASQKQTRWYATTDLDQTLQEALARLGISRESIDPLSEPLEAELSAARAILEKHQPPWVNLVQGPLAPRHAWRRVRTPAWVSLAAVITILLTLIAVLQLRAHAYNKIADRYDQQARSAFAQVMPGQAIPTSPQTRLRNRLKQLRGEQGLATDGGEQLHQDAPALRLLHDALAALPNEQRFAITDLRIEADELRLTGHARSHKEADQIASSLRRNSPYVVKPPSTNNLRAGGVRFTLQAHYSPAAPTPTPQVPAVDPNTNGASLAQQTQRKQQP